NLWSVSRLDITLYNFHAHNHFLSPHPFSTKGTLLLSQQKDKKKKQDKVTEEGRCLLDLLSLFSGGGSDELEASCKIHRSISRASPSSAVVDSTASVSQIPFHLLPQLYFLFGSLWSTSRSRWLIATYYER